MNFQKITADFAAQHVSGQTDLQTDQLFSKEIRRKMGEAGLFRIGLPERYGGDNGSCLDLLQAGETFVRHGRNLGLGVSWIFQQIIARHLLGTFGRPEQCCQYLKAATRGKCMLSFAVSEPGRGASPKTLTTKATWQEQFYCLQGEKSYLTNGPIADVFIVIAVTDESTPRKAFTAFLVPRNTPGLTVLPPMSLNFLKSSPHGAMNMNQCQIEQQALLGTKGKAWQDMVVPLGEIEDTIMMGPVLGGMAAQLDILKNAVQNIVTPEDRTLQSEAGALVALFAAMETIAYEAARRLDDLSNGSLQPDGDKSPVPLVIALARLATEYCADITRLTQQVKISLPEMFFRLQTDIASLGALQKRRLQIRQEKTGRALFHNYTSNIKTLR
ncbi:MAG: acyl-CoA/acyl-ACP dehydrogenase [Syntrophaceae bacterium]|jgi:alkylation response protein AidB-like acyl-CoA dehydrogenase|nr:acyl-CoA/acyl-ACP dehydrogenase [Syntrophaceae bacterium]HOC59279.1 acyl-CoA dehydrogenase family protein [Smithellaceae bacterium]HQM45759.1 acyl-CoA dehydrogenase family protein [Smithellaceae bacterium]